MTRSPDGPILVMVLLADLDCQALDLLIQGGKGDAEPLCGFGLVPAALFEHVDDDAPLAVFHDSEQRRARTRIECWHRTDRKSTRLNSSHLGISYAVFCLK